MDSHGEIRGDGRIPIGTNWTVKVAFDNLPSGVIADSITIENIHGLGEFMRLKHTAVIDNTIPEAVQKRKTLPTEVSKELSRPESTVAESDREQSENSEESVLQINSEINSGYNEPDEASEKTFEASKAESQSTEVSQEQSIDPSARFNGSTKIERLGFTIEASSDNIFDGVDIHFKNEGDDHVFVETKWMSYKIDAILTDTDGNEYEESVRMPNLGRVDFGDEQTINIQFENLPEGVIAKTITIKYIGSFLDFSGGGNAYLDYVSTAVIENNI